MKRVLSVIHAPRWGGIHTIMERVGPICGQSGWEWIVLLPTTKGENGRARLEKAGLKVVEIPLRRIRKTLNPLVQLGFFLSIPLDIWRLTRVIRDQKIDVVQVCGLMHFHSAIAGRLMGKPVVWQLHSDQPPAFLKRFFTPWVVRIADSIMTSGASLRHTHPGLERAADRIVAFRAPVDTSRFKPDSEVRVRIRSTLGIGPNDLLVGTVGGQGPNKNHQMIVEVAATTAKSAENIRYFICGISIEQHRELYARTVKAQADNLNKEYPGTVSIFEPSRDISEYMAALDVFVLPSRGEGASIVTAEAMASGLPVVANDVGSLKDSVADGKTGFLNKSLSVEEMARHLAKLTSDPELRLSMGAAGRSVALSAFSLQACAAAHIDAYALAEVRLGRKPDRSAFWKSGQDG